MEEPSQVQLTLRSQSGPGQQGQRGQEAPGPTSSSCSSSSMLGRGTRQYRKELNSSLSEGTVLPSGLG